MNRQHTLLSLAKPALPLTLLLLALGAGCNQDGGAAQLPPAAAAARPATARLDAVGPIPGPAQLLTTASNPYQDNPSALADGRRLFMWMNCAGCHGDHGGGGMGPSLRDPAWIYGSSDADVFSSIAEGRAHGMPAWGTLLPSDSIWKLDAYIHSLGTPQEPEAPQ
jgi:cytochrome c oxidase cbb3-type subunit 3